MKNKLKVIIIGLIIIVTATNLPPLTAKASISNYYTSPNIKETTPAIAPRGDIIEWRYKIVNGILYKRQYNHTRSCWIGEWEAIN